MTDWVSYSLTDLLPFSRATYEGLYALHNARFGPAPVVGIAVGVVALLLLPIPLTWCLISALMLWGLDSALWPFPAIGVLLGLGLALDFGTTPSQRRSTD